MSEQARRERSARQIWASPGSSHDRLIGILSVALPMAIGVLAAFLVMAPLFSGGDVSFVLDKNKVEVAKERMKLQSAIYRGEDSQGRPFALNAGSALQKSSAEPIVALNALAAQIELSDGPAELRANQGRYDMERERLAVDGPVRFRAADGYALDTRDATIDLKTRRLETDSRVTGRVPQGSFSGDSMAADLEERTVRLEGNARLRIDPNNANRR